MTSNQPEESSNTVPADREREARIASHDEMRASLRRCEQLANEATRHARAMQDSTSWRLTAPLRKIVHWLRGQPDTSTRFAVVTSSTLADSQPNPPVPVDRTQRLHSLVNIDSGVGLEIGPLDKAIVPRKTGRQIFYCDYADREYLRKRSAGDPNVDVDRIPEIDFVAGAISPDTFGGRKFDYIIASHVIEHIPDVINWLRLLLAALKPDGRLVLAIPDRRYTFDLIRPLSTVGQMLEALWQNRLHPSVSQVYDGNAMAVKSDAAQAWQATPEPVVLERYYTRQHALRLARDVHDNEAHHDCHCWVFEYEHFVACIAEFIEIGVLDTRVDFRAAPEYGSLEFIVALSPACAKAQS